MPIINSHLSFNKCSGCDTTEGIQPYKTRGKEAKGRAGQKNLHHPRVSLNYHSSKELWN